MKKYYIITDWINGEDSSQEYFDTLEEACDALDHALAQTNSEIEGRRRKLGHKLRLKKTIQGYAGIIDVPESEREDDETDEELLRRIDDWRYEVDGSAAEQAELKEHSYTIVLE